MDNYETLKMRDFTIEQIVKIVAHGGGSNNIAAVIENFEMLLKAGFTIEQIVRIAGKIGGSKKVTAAIAELQNQ